MYARRREPESAFAYAASIADKDYYTYAALLNACAKVHLAIRYHWFLDIGPVHPPCVLLQGQHPPYALSQVYAVRAQEVFTEMATAGLQPTVVHYGALMDCQVTVVAHAMMLGCTVGAGENLALVTHDACCMLSGKGRARG